MVKRLSSNIAGGGGGGGTTSPGGSDTQVQFNDGGAFGGDGGLTYNKTTDELTVAGDINLDDGGTFSTTLQSVTPTANRTISFPDATGTVALVSGSNGTVQYNEGGVLKGNSDFTVDPDWNDASTVFTGLRLNVTDTASAAGSNLLDLQVGGTSQFSVNNTGGVFCSGIGSSGSFLSLAPAASGPRLSIFAGYCLNRSTDYYGWNDITAISSGSTGDLRLYRDAANTLAQRNGTNAQTFRLYNTYTDASNYERGFFRWNANQLQIGVEAAGTGNTFRQLALFSQGSASPIMLLGSDTTTVSSKFKIGNYFVNNKTNGWSMSFASGNGNSKTSFGVLSNTSFASTANGQFVWVSTNYGTNQANATPDTGLARDSAGVVKITDGSTGTGYLRQVPIAVSSLPTAAAGNAGTRIFVSDASVAAAGNFGSVVAGGGSNTVPVYSDGGAWRIG